MKNIKLLTVLLLSIGLIPVYFNACSSKHYEIGEGYGDFASLKSCSVGPYFERNYLPFLKVNCSTCHNSRGRGKGAFADSNVEVAWSAFQTVGFEKINRFAVNPSHNSPYTGAHHSLAVNKLETGLEAAQLAEAACGNDTSFAVDTSEWIKTRSKGINADDTLNAQMTGADTEPIVWNLGSDVIPSADASIDIPDLNGIKIQIKARIRRLDDKLFYEFFEPTLDLSSFNPSVTPANDSDPENNNKLLGVRIQGIRLKVNGKFIFDETTFTFIDETVSFDPNNNYVDIQDQTLLSGGTMIALGDLSSSDLVSIAFEKISFVEVDPPPPPVYVTFSNSTQTVLEDNATSTKTEVLIGVTLSAPPQGRVIVTVGQSLPDSNSARPISTGEYDNLNGSDIVGIYNFDWDFKIENNRIEFLPTDIDGNGNPVVKTFKVILANDRRNENTESVYFQLVGDNVSGARVAATTDTGTPMITQFQLFITDNDSDQPVYNPTSEDNALDSFQTLFMMPDGFKDSCLHCHNNVETNKYDLTSFDSMILSNALGTRQINDAESSDMYRRLLPKGEYDDLLKMPGDNGLDNDFVKDLIREWINKGALNN